MIHIHFPRLDVLMEVKRVLVFPKFSGLILVAYKAIIKQNKKHVIQKYGAILPRHTIIVHTITCADLKRINYCCCTSFNVQAFVRATTNCFNKLSHNFCTCNGCHVGLFIKTGSI